MAANWWCRKKRCHDHLSLRYIVWPSQSGHRADNGNTQCPHFSHLVIFSSLVAPLVQKIRLRSSSSGTIRGAMSVMDQL